MNQYWKNGIFGTVAGDALGVPVEFRSRSEIAKDPVTGMREFGTHNQPMGTWSDDSSLMLATFVSIREKEGIDCMDIMNRFQAWYEEGEYSPFQQVFDIGIATTSALSRFREGKKPEFCGGTGEYDNGNGSLMRILPVCLYLFDRQKCCCTSEDENIFRIHQVSALTHGHLRSQIACGIYYFMVKAILEKGSEKTASKTEEEIRDGMLRCLQKGINDSFTYYRRHADNYRELMHYSRLIDLKAFRELPESEIKSSGYVVHTLEAAIWCLLNSSSFAEAALKAVNLGEDTDTTAAVAGGLAGLFYGIGGELGIPEAWMNVIQKKDWIEEITA